MSKKSHHILFRKLRLTEVSSARHIYLLAVGIQVDRLLQDQAAGNLQDLEEVAQGRVYPCLPSEGLPSVPFAGLPLAWLPGVTVGESCGATAGLEASVADPLLEEGMRGKAAGLQSLFEEGCEWVLELHN